MADIDKLKDKIKSTIYPNGRGAINAADHQEMLLEIAYGIADTDSRIEYVSKRLDELAQSNGTFDKNGVYPNLTAGDLLGRGESVSAEINFRASGGKSVRDGKAYIKAIEGNSVVWNQYIDKLYISEDRAIATREGTTMISGHKYLLMRTKTHGASYVLVKPDFYDYRLLPGESYSFFTNSVDCVSNGVNPTYPHIYCTDESGYVQLVDLTKMFGQGNEPTTIEEYNKRKPIVADEYAYNEGQLIHMNAAGIKSVGDNAWDEQWDAGGLTTSGEPTTASNAIRSRNYIKVLPNEAYYSNKTLRVYYYDDEYNFLSYEGVTSSTSYEFTTPSNCTYIKFLLTGIAVYNNDIIISLVHSGWKQELDAGYQPYWADTLQLPIIERYFPQGMKKVGNAYDEIRFNKTIGKWEKVIRIGTRAYQVNDADNVAYLTDGKTTCYPLEEAIVTQITEPFRDYYNVADFGTEEMLAALPSAPFCAKIVYQFNAVDMLREHELEITELQKAIATMQLQLSQL